LNYILGGAYKALLFALYFKDVLGEEITMISHSKVISKYCKAEKINNIQFERPRPAVTSILKLLTLKKKLDEIIKKIGVDKNDKFFLTGNAKGYDTYYLAKELSKKGATVYYKATDLEGRTLKRFKPPWYKPIFVRGGLVRILLKVFLDLDLIYYDTHNVPCLGIDNDFLKKYNIKEYATDKPTEELISKALKKSKISFEEHNNLIIGQGPLANIVKFNSIVKLYEKLFKLPIDFVFKKHPESEKSITSDYSFLSYYKLFKHCKEVPDYYPVELFMNNTRKNVISICSTSLITASKYSHLNAISLLELVEWHNKETKEEWKTNLTNASNKKILFPNIIEELEKLLQD